ncbi:MAG: hypothetical protein HY927_09995 [Elusimicrobia bacterium]|nr:hypothetical protein [Elusimicrobiota bacterium]
MRKRHLWVGAAWLCCCAAGCASRKARLEMEMAVGEYVGRHYSAVVADLGQPESRISYGQSGEILTFASPIDDPDTTDRDRVRVTVWTDANGIVRDMKPEAPPGYSWGK